MWRVVPFLPAGSPTFPASPPASQVYVSRMPYLVPVLTVVEKDSTQQQMPQMGHAQMPLGAAVSSLQPPPPKPTLKHGGKGR